MPSSRYVVVSPSRGGFLKVCLISCGWLFKSGFPVNNAIKTSDSSSLTPKGDPNGNTKS